MPHIQIEDFERRLEALRGIEEARQEMATHWEKVRTALGLHITEVRFHFDGDRLAYVGLKSRETGMPVISAAAMSSPALGGEGCSEPGCGSRVSEVTGAER